MKRHWLPVTAMLTLVGLASWILLAPGPWQRLLGQLPGAATAVTEPARAAGVRKCLTAGKLTYTDADCPAGSQQPALGGAITVLPSQAVQPAGDPSAQAGTVRELLGKPDQGSLRDKRMEAVINK